MTVEIEDTLEEVEKLLSKYPETRNNDFYLSWLYMKYILKMPLPYLPFEEIAKVGGKLATIRRCRQHIQNDQHRFPPTRPEVLNRRRQKEEEFRRWFGSRIQGSDFKDQYKNWGMFKDER